MSSGNRRILDPDYQYTPRGMTRRPCPGCGETEAWVIKDGICRPCRTLINEAKAARAALADADELMPVLYIKRTTSVHGSHHGPDFRGAPFEHRDALEKRLGSLVKAVSTPAPATAPDNPPYLWGDDEPGQSWSGGECLMIGRRVRYALRDFVAAVGPALQAAEADGFSDGSNALRRLAEGDTSVADFRDYQTRRTLGPEIEKLERRRHERESRRRARVPQQQEETDDDDE